MNPVPDHQFQFPWSRPSHPPDQTFPFNRTAQSNLGPGPSQTQRQFAPPQGQHQQLVRSYPNPLIESLRSGGGRRSRGRSTASPIVSRPIGKLRRFNYRNGGVGSKWGIQVSDPAFRSSGPLWDIVGTSPGTPKSQNENDLSMTLEQSSPISGGGSGPGFSSYKQLFSSSHSPGPVRSDLSSPITYYSPFQYSPMGPPPPLTPTPSLNFSDGSSYSNFLSPRIPISEPTIQSPIVSRNSIVPALGREGADTKKYSVQQLLSFVVERGESKFQGTHPLQPKSRNPSTSQRMILPSQLFEPSPGPVPLPAQVQPHHSPTSSDSGHGHSPTSPLLQLFSSSLSPAPAQSAKFQEQDEPKAAKRVRFAMDLMEDGQKFQLL